MINMYHSTNLLGKEPSAGFSKEPSAWLSKEPSAGFNKEPSAGFDKEPSASFDKQPSARLSRWLTRITLCLLLSACASAPTPPPPPPAPEPPARIDPSLLANFLDAAERAIQAGELTYPPERSALAQYQQILELEPGQDDALRGIESIVEIFIERALVALGKRQFAEARSMLARARLINPSHPSIEPTQAQIQLIAEAQREHLRLDQEALRREQTSVQAELKALAKSPPGTSCRFYIWAKSDSQGRWIYNALTSGASGTRLQAQVEIRLPARVERLCFDT